VKDGTPIQLNGTRITPFRVAQDYVYAFLFESAGKRALIAMDELHGWIPPEQVRGVDLAYLPAGIAEFHPFTGERQFAADHPVLKTEATLHQTLYMLKVLNARHTVLTHIEETEGLSYDDYLRLQQKLRNDGLNVTFAWDAMEIEV
jgi:phosphoribosyl 1,2-cyclic phosphate phosphodiesterase